MTKEYTELLCIPDRELESDGIAVLIVAATFYPFIFCGSKEQYSTQPACESGHSQVLAMCIS